MTDQPQDRKSESLLYNLEHRLLQYLVRKLPLGIKPDHLTLLGIVGAILTAGGYFFSTSDPAFLWLASFGLLLNWFGDSLDGTLARHRKIERPIYGFYVDHTTDVLAMMMIIAGIGLSPYARLDIFLLVAITYLAIACVAFIRRIVTGTLQISFYGNGPTEMRLIGILLNIALFSFEQPVFVTMYGTLTLLDSVAIIVSFGSLLLLVISIWKEGRSLAKSDR